MSEKTLKALEKTAHIFAEMSRREDDAENLFWLGMWTGIMTAVAAVKEDSPMFNQKRDVE